MSAEKTAKLHGNGKPNLLIQREAGEIPCGKSVLASTRVTGDPAVKNVIYGSDISKNTTTFPMLMSATTATNNNKVNKNRTHLYT